MTNHGKPWHVLIVEDDRVLAKYFGLLLLLEGYTVTISHTGLKGVRWAKAIQPDLIVWDVGLPDANDAEWMVPELPDVPLIIATGQHDVRVPIGATLLRKPVFADVFKEAIREALERSR